MGVGPVARMMTLLWGARYSLLTALLAGFGRAAAEVGAVMIVGGNIDGFTRTMTTTIALETSKGDLPLAMGLGLVLVAIVLAVNAAAWGTRVWAERLGQNQPAAALHPRRGEEGKLTEYLEIPGSMRSLSSGGALRRPGDTTPA
jgi:hypothetical protein